MYRIAQALKHQRLRKQFPKGVELWVDQTGTDAKYGTPIYSLRAKVLHKPRILDLQKSNHPLALMSLTHEMWAMQAGLEEAGVKVKVPKI